MPVCDVRWTARSLCAVASCVVAVGLGTAPAQAVVDVTPPNVNVHPGLLFKVDTRLSDNSLHPTIPATVTWTAYDDVGVAAQSGYFSPPGETVPLKPSTRRHRFGAVPLQAGGAGEVDAYLYASDAAGNEGSGGHSFYVALNEEGAMTATAGWSTATCDCWSAGAVYRSTKAGASLQYQFSGAAMAVIGDEAPGRGDLQVYVDGRLQATVHTAGTTRNRLVLYQKRFSSYETHTVKLVAATSARVDVDALVTQFGY